MKAEIWLHVPTFTLALVIGDFGEFYSAHGHEESFWGIFRDEDDGTGWTYVCDE